MLLLILLLIKRIFCHWLTLLSFEPMLLSTSFLSHSYTQAFFSDLLVDCDFCIDIFFNKIERFRSDYISTSFRKCHVLNFDLWESDQGDLSCFWGVLWQAIRMVQVTIVTQLIRLYDYTLDKLSFTAYYFRLMLVVELVRIMVLLLLLEISLPHKACKGSLRHAYSLHTWKMLRC